MSSKAIDLFGPAAVVGECTLYTPHFDISEYNALCLRLVCTGSTPTIEEAELNVAVQHSNLNDTGDWVQIGIFDTVYSIDQLETSEDLVFTIRNDNLMSFVRLRIEMTGVDLVGFTFSVTGVARFTL